MTPPVFKAFLVLDEGWKPSHAVNVRPSGTAYTMSLVLRDRQERKLHVSANPERYSSTSCRLSTSFRRNTETAADYLNCHAAFTRQPSTPRRLVQLLAFPIFTRDVRHQKKSLRTIQKKLVSSAASAHNRPANSSTRLCTLTLGDYSFKPLTPFRPALLAELTYPQSRRISPRDQQHGRATSWRHCHATPENSVLPSGDSSHPAWVVRVFNCQPKISCLVPQQKGSMSETAGRMSFML